MHAAQHPTRLLISSVASTLALLVAACGQANDAGAFRNTGPADTASAATPPGATDQAQGAVTAKDCGAAGVSCTEAERASSLSAAMAMERDGMEMERKGMAMAIEGMTMGHKGMAMGPDGMAMERAGMVMEREGMAMQVKGMAMARDGMAMQTRGMAMGDPAPGGTPMGDDKKMPMMDDDMPMAKPGGMMMGNDKKMPMMDDDMPMPKPKTDTPMKDMPDE